jgi:hypothetical protein
MSAKGLLNAIATNTKTRTPVKGSAKDFRRIVPVMTSRDFCYWLQGHFELATVTTDGSVILTAEQVQMIQKHLSLVFVHEIDPSYIDTQDRYIAALEARGKAQDERDKAKDDLILIITKQRDDALAIKCNKTSYLFGIVKKTRCY